MKQKLTKPLLSFLSFLLIFSMIGPTVASATSESKEKIDSQEVEALAEDLEFLMEKAAIYDADDNLVTFDFDMLSERFGEVKELQILEEEINKVSCKPKVTTGVKGYAVSAAAEGTWGDCMIDALKDHFGIALIEVALTGGLWGYLEKKAYKEAAKLLLKIGIGGNVIGLTAFLTWYSAKCLEGRGPWASNTFEVDTKSINSPLSNTAILT